ncbi:MAG: DUF2804 domain-containing protein [Deltaproteobacteria bacterium]|nr:DUF2804 domain-containing protein [Deltaproteobacteria bacterium]
MLSEHLPILDRRGAPARAEAVYREREVTDAVDLCDGNGRLNPAAVGWSRRPLVRANLAGHWLRKKRWNFWNWIGPEGVFSVTLADIDYASFCAFAVTDFATGETVRGGSHGLPGRIALPEHVERDVSFERGGLSYQNRIDGNDLRVRFSGTATGSVSVHADFAVRRPADHESLNVVVPWSPTRFQLNSKHAALPCDGEVRVGSRSWRVDPQTWFAVQDWGRGVWPYRSFWNWGVATGMQNGRLLGINFGARWTTGTGSNENGILVDGRLHKVMEDLRWDYDPASWMRPWRVRAEHSGDLDLVLEPVAVQQSKLDIGVIATGGACAFGRWRGRVRAGGEELAIDGLLGWAEEFSHRW